MGSRRGNAHDRLLVAILQPDTRAEPRHSIAERDGVSLAFG